MKKSITTNYFMKIISVFIALLLIFQLSPSNSAITRAENTLKLSVVSSKVSNGYKATMTIQNTASKTVNGWTLKLKKSNFAITSIKNAKSKVSGDSIIITPTSSTKKIVAKGKISFTLTGKGTFVKKFKYELNPSKAVATPTPVPTAVPTVTPTPAPTAMPTVIPTPTSSVTPVPSDYSSPETIEIPSFLSLETITKLPDPFLFKTGSRKGTSVTSLSDWTARRNEISALAQAFEFGVKPSKPETITGSFGSNAITITCKQNGKTISFQCNIQYPTTGEAPYPAMIGVNWNTLNTAEILKLGVALITFPADEIAEEKNGSSRGKGKFFDLYGSTYDAGALIAWAWGVDRLIDALEMTPSANINPTKLGVTGGSRNGKGALVIGAFDERIALTVPQESGNGGASGWRTADAMMKDRTNVQTLSQIIGENVWFAKSLNQFSGKTTKLPFDHDEIMALCAPRGLLVIENPDMVWLGNLSCYNTSMAGHMIYEALGVPDNMGFSTVGGHAHCQFPATQQPELTAYIQKFLLDKEVDTKVFRVDSKYKFTFDHKKWVDWTIPTLQ
ncbi:MAG: glucuronyl esterase domain-containing protein [Mobilitalea sp.]